MSTTARLSRVVLEEDAGGTLPPLIEADRAQAVADLAAANHFAPLDKSHTLAHLRALDGRALTRRTRTDNDEIVSFHVQLI